MEKHFSNNNETLLNCSDELLIKQIRSNDKNSPEAELTLSRRYQEKSKTLYPFYKEWAKSLYVTKDEIYAHGIESYAIALNAYKEDRDSKFFSFWRTIASHSISNYLRKVATEHYNFDLFGIRLDSQIKEGSNMSYSEVIGENDSEIIHQINYEDKISQLNETIHKEFSKEEQIILSSRLNGLSFKEIALALGKPEKHIRYRYDRLKSKLNKLKN